MSCDGKCDGFDSIRSLVADAKELDPARGEGVARIDGGVVDIDNAD